MSDYRKIYEFNLPWYKKYLNRLGIGGRVTLALTTLLGIALFPLTREGLKNSKVVDLRHDWIRTKVRDINNSDFASLDEEDPPQPLQPKSNVQLFREEFSRLYGKDSTR